MLRPIIIQICNDESFLKNGKNSDFYLRQKRYAANLFEQDPTCTLYCLIKSCTDEIKLQEENLIFQTYTNLKPTLLSLNQNSYIKAISPQSLFGDSYISLFFCKEYGIPLLGQLHFDPNSFPLSYLKRKIFNKMLGHHQAIRVVSTSIKSYVAQYCSLPCEVIPVFSVLPSVEVLKEKRLLFVGEITKDKGADYFVHLARKILKDFPDFHFDIAGEGPLKTKLQSQINFLSLEKNFTFHGHVSHADLSTLYARAMLLVHPAKHEGFGRVILEAAFFATPTICFNTAGAKDLIIHKKTGIIASDENSFYDLLKELLSDSGHIKELGIEALKNAQTNYQVKTLSAAWVSFLLKHSRKTEQSPIPFTFKRYLKLALSPYSLLRAMEYELLPLIKLEGKILDIGGGEKTSYNHLLKIEGKLESINIDLNIKPTYIKDLELPLELPANEYDHIISFNVFEHIRHDEQLLKECFKTLKEKGCIHFFVPFLFKRHGSPYDFHRHTHDEWTNRLKECGFTDIRISPLVVDDHSSALSIVHFFNFRFIKILVLLISFLRLKLFSWKRGRMSDFALGYFIEAKK